VIEGKFMVIEQAMATPKNCFAAAAYVQDFIEEMKAIGLVAAGLERSGQTCADVAPLYRQK
jgi:polar amino acid transport system substrate-binding protein